MPHVIVGLGGLLSDPSVCVIKDGQIAAAVEQAKVSRQERLGTFPDEAFTLTLEMTGVDPAEVGCVAIARPFASGAESVAQLALRARFPQSEIVVVEHHHAHAASAYYLSGFNQGAVLSIDRAGDFRSGVLFRGHGNDLTPVREMYFPDSLGDLYNRVTSLLGFEPRADEHKVQWLSASGEPAYLEVMQKILNAGGPGWPKLDRSYFDSDGMMHGGFSSKFYDATGLATREALTPKMKADVASSLQTAVEEAVIATIAAAESAKDVDARRQTTEKVLTPLDSALEPAPVLREFFQSVSIAGGLALNALLIRAMEQRFNNVFVQPVAGNAGTSLGAALYAWHNFYREKERVPLETLCLGPAYSAQQIKQVLENCKLHFRYILTEGELIDLAIRALSDNKIVAWMQGRMEFGPRALGNRSILASPLNPFSTENLNVYIKHREGFRKFAASVPEEMASEFFEAGPNACYLATVAQVKPAHKETFSAALLGGDLIRVHTVRKQANPLYHSLLIAAGKATGLPVLYNTSFNLFGDPLVCTPRDAVRSFYSSGIDALFAGDFYLEK